MRFKADNRVLIIDQPNTLLTTSVSATGTTLIVRNNGGFTNGDYILIGRIGEEKSEIVRISATVTSGTSLTVTALTFDHDEDTVIIKISYSKVVFYHGTTIVPGDATVLSTPNIDPTEVYTYYEDTTYTSGYGFIRFYDANADNYSTYSDAISYTGYTDKMLRNIRKKIRRLLNETDELNSSISNVEIDEEINLAQREVAHDRLWSFYETIKSFSTVANQYKYTISTEVHTLFDAQFDTQPMIPVPMHKFNLLRWDTDTTGDPTHLAIWDKVAYLYPYPTDSADTTTLNGAISSATATTITVVSSSDFQSQGRIIIDSEVISYTGKTATTFTGCVRGEEGTTATTHLTAATVTERDVVYLAQEEPTNLVDETDETQISEPSVLAYKAAAELALGVPNQNLHDRLLIKYDRGMAQLRKIDEPKFKSTFGRVRSNNIQDVGIIRNPNDFPTGLQ